MNTEIEKVLRELVEVARELRVIHGTIVAKNVGLDDTITRAESLLARLSDERPVAYRVKTDRGTVINGWMDGAPNAMVIAHAAQDGYSIELAYSRPQLAEVAVCGGCNGRGEVGGFVGMDSGYQTDPCPFCTIEGIENAIRSARRRHAQTGAVDDSPEIERMVAERDRMVNQTYAEKSP